MIAGPSGLVARGRRFSFADVSVASGDVDIDAIRLIQTRSIACADGQENCDVIKHDFTFPPALHRDSSHGRDSRDKWNTARSR